MIDIKVIRHQVEHDSYGTGHSWVRTGSLIALCDEIERLTACLKKANDQAEHFEREWYLRGDELDRLRSTINEFHHAIADAGWHPGRTDDLLTDIIRAKGLSLPNSKSRTSTSTRCRLNCKTCATGRQSGWQSRRRMLRANSKTLSVIGFSR